MPINVIVTYENNVKLCSIVYEKTEDDLTSLRYDLMECADEIKAEINIDLHGILIKKMEFGYDENLPFFEV